MDYFDQQNLKFFDFLEEMFDLKKAKSWDDISKGVTEFKMKRTYRVFAELFPRKYKYYDELEKSKEGFKTIHFAKLKGYSIINEVVRFSLYSDQIIVFHPLQNPAVTNQTMNPGRNPLYWMPDFLEALYFYIVIQKWVKAGIVKLIINPYEYDLHIRDKVDVEVKKRITDTVDFEEIVKIEREGAMTGIAEQFAVLHRHKNKGQIKTALLEMANPRFNDEEAEEFAQVIIDFIPKINPLYKDLRIKPQKVLATTKGGGPVESILMISQAANANIYTPEKSIWYQMQKMGLNDFWLKANHLYSQIPLNFLNNVDTSFALEIRKEDRLAGVRTELRKILSELNDIDINNFSETKMITLFESFDEEVKKSEEDWKGIKRDALLAKKILIASNAAPLITNTLNIIPVTIATSLGLLFNYQYEKQKINSFRIKNPVSVFVDLKNQEQSFFSQLKNCLL